MRLVDIYEHPQGDELAFEILKERPLEHGISHKRMPNWNEHKIFMHARPFRFWFVIETEDIMDPQLRPSAVGVMDVLPTNEFGVHIFKRHQGRGYGKAAVRLLIKNYAPLPEIPAVRNGTWLANVAPANKRAKEFFAKLGFKCIQETMAL